jgi:hypothetical protein
MRPPLVKLNPHLSTLSSAVSHLLPQKIYDDSEAINWCQKHDIKYIVSIDENEYNTDIFKFNEEDAVMFKLTWL